MTQFRQNRTLLKNIFSAFLRRRISVAILGGNWKREFTSQTEHKLTEFGIKTELTIWKIDWSVEKYGFLAFNTFFVEIIVDEFFSRVSRFSFWIEMNESLENICDILFVPLSEPSSAFTKNFQKKNPLKLFEHFS